MENRNFLPYQMTLNRFGNNLIFKHSNHPNQTNFYWICTFLDNEIEPGCWGGLGQFLSFLVAVNRCLANLIQVRLFSNPPHYCQGFCGAC